MFNYMAPQGKARRWCGRRRSSAEGDTDGGNRSSKSSQAECPAPRGAARCIFKGVLCAAVDAAALAPPGPPIRWGAPADFGAACVQPPRRRVDRLCRHRAASGYLTSTSGAGQRRASLIVYFHGGAFSARLRRSADVRSGHLRRGVVWSRSITIGAQRFHGASGAERQNAARRSGNYGLMDQIAAPLGAAGTLRVRRRSDG